MKHSLIARDSAAFFHQEGSSPCPFALVAAQGAWLEDVEGRRFIDLHGNTAHHLGYGHPTLTAALKRQLDELPFAPRRFTNTPAVLLAEKLLAKWPGNRAKVLFATGGSDAIEIALKLARTATGRHETISFEGSYHGHGFGAFGLSRAMPDKRLGPFLPGRHHIPGYWQAGGAQATLAELRSVLAKNPDRIDALIAEPIRSNCHVPPDDFWRQVKLLCAEHGVLLIFDEIPSGLGKTGRFFAFEHFGVVPDAVVLGKALGGGIVPIAAVIADARLDVAPDLDLGHYTHEKNPLTTRAALTTIEIIESEGLTARAQELGAHVMSRIARLAAEHPFLAGGRGKGLLLALDFRPDHCGMAAGVDFIDALVRAFWQEGLSTTGKGPASVGFSPPLTISDDEITQALARIERVARQPELVSSRQPAMI
ncbi:aminotransferase class III-fold pyridoxal phosphate-dependent enzyme [Taklimakanibacter lacteus]|uniref:aminotransferase class III-fold pyridoxal phosphate-dependent enzyme n=1 Tax=Taklimakanibacter lacteus TaxID=2268456 RepID=UPI000E665E9E